MSYVAPVATESAALLVMSPNETLLSCTRLPTSTSVAPPVSVAYPSVPPFTSISPAPPTVPASVAAPVSVSVCPPSASEPELSQKFPPYVRSPPSSAP